MGPTTGNPRPILSLCTYIHISLQEYPHHVPLLCNVTLIVNNKSASNICLNFHFNQSTTTILTETTFVSKWRKIAPKTNITYQKLLDYRYTNKEHNWNYSQQRNNGVLPHLHSFQSLKWFTIGVYVPRQHVHISHMFFHK